MSLSRINISLTIGVIALVVNSQLSIAQTENDDIARRSLLLLDSVATHSTTANASVQWQCINKALTKKCLVYHNDQWFTFQVPGDGKYFLNIGGQHCKDGRGLQVILIEGNPCETATYRIKQCIDRIPQEDVFVPLDSLKEGVHYLVNIDGFLGDFCEFNIALATKPYGFHYSLSGESEMLSGDADIISDSIVHLTIRLTEDAGKRFDRLEIFRSKKDDVKSEVIHSMPVQRNAYGAAIGEYQFRDTLRAFGTYQYRVLIAAGDREPEQMSLPPIRYFSSGVRVVPPADSREVFIDIPVEIKRRHEMDVYVYNALSLQLLRYEHVEVDGRNKNVLPVAVTRYIDSGVSQLLVKTVGPKRHDVKKYKFLLNNEGRMILLE